MQIPGGLLKADIGGFKIVYGDCSVMGAREVVNFLERDRNPLSHKRIGEGILKAATL